MMRWLYETTFNPITGAHQHYSSMAQFTSQASLPACSCSLAANEPHHHSDILQLHWPTSDCECVYTSLNELHGESNTPKFNSKRLNTACIKSLSVAAIYCHIA